MAISKDDTVLTYSKFKEFWTSFAVLFNKKLDGSGIKNNDTTTDSGYVLDARVGKVHGDEIDTLKDQMNGCYIAYDSDGKLGIKASKNGAVQRFRQPTGTATAAQVLSGATFANASNDNMTGTMPNNGAINKTITPSGNNTASVTIPAGYTSGGTVVADGTTAYKAGMTAADARVSDTSASFAAGQKDIAVLVATSEPLSNTATADITAGTYKFVWQYITNGAYTESSGVSVKVGNATYFNNGGGGNEGRQGVQTLELPAGSCTIHVTSYQRSFGVLYKVV